MPNQPEDVDIVDSNRPMIEIRDLTYRYPDGRQALSRLEFRVDRGEFVGLVGPNGAGKSTLLLHLNGILPEHLPRTETPGTGESASGVWIDGHQVCRERLVHARRTVGLMFQNPDDQLFCPTVLEDVAFGPLNAGRSPDEARKLAIEMLASVDLAGFGNRVPHHLSMGERKRVCLAGVLACKPAIVALDEPTSNLDPRGRRALIELLQLLPVTKIIATHDLELVLELCQRVLLLDEGTLVADGPVNDILRQESLLLQHGLEMPISLKIGRRNTPSMVK